MPDIDAGSAANCGTTTSAYTLTGRREHVILDGSAQFVAAGPERQTHGQLVIAERPCARAGSDLRLLSHLRNEPAVTVERADEEVGDAFRAGQSRWLSFVNRLLHVHDDVDG